MPTALIIGGSSDIGLSVARKFAEEGFDIQMTARKAELLNSTQTDIKIRYSKDCQIYSFEAEDISGHQAFFNKLNPIPDVIIYSIGYMGSDDQVLKSAEETYSIIYSNYAGAVSILNIFAAHFAKEKKGSIIGISSVAGERGRQSNLIYGSAKAAFSAYLSGLRNYLQQYAVSVITIKPGFVNTKMTSHLTLSPLLTATPELVGRRVYQAYNSKKNVVYIKGIWRLIMFVIRSIPESIFKKLKL